MRLARLGPTTSGLYAIRAATEADVARKAADHDRTMRHEDLAPS